jgi:Fic family protein
MQIDGYRALRITRLHHIGGVQALREYRLASHHAESLRALVHVRAFIPAPLPPSTRALDLASLQTILAEANQAIGRLDGLTSAFPDLKFFLNSHVRKEAVLSSQIEGTQSSLSDLLLYENAETPGVPLDDVQEVSNYFAALNH